MKRVIKSMSILLGCGVLLFTACKKEKAIEQVDEQTVHTMGAIDADRWEFIPKNDDFAAIFKENQKANTEVFTVNANERIFIETEGGVILELAANALENADGGLIEGNVRVFFNGLTDRGQMVVQDRGTSGINEDGTGVTALSSGGEFFIQIRQGGEALVLNKPLGVSVPTDAPDPDMQMFVAAEGTGDDLVWKLAEDKPLEVIEREGGDGGGGTYYHYDLLPDLGNQWPPCNIDKFNSGCPGALSDVSVNVPAGYDPTNTELYMIPCGSVAPWRIANFDNWNAATNSFEEHGGRICEGACVHFVLVTNVGGTLEYEVHTSVTITPGAHVEVFTAPFTPITASALVAIINALP